MKPPLLIDGEIFTDNRGVIRSLNNFSFGEVQRFYFIHHPDASVIRGWHGHQFEKKWFHCVKGSFQIGLVEIDNWEHPSPDLIPLRYDLMDTNSQILCIPEGYANIIKANEKDSILLVFSGKNYKEALSDSWRYQQTLWNQWMKN